MSTAVVASAGNDTTASDMAPQTPTTTTPELNSTQQQLVSQVREVGSPRFEHISDLVIATAAADYCQNKTDQAEGRTLPALPYGGSMITQGFINFTILPNLRQGYSGMTYADGAVVAAITDGYC